MDFPQYKCSLLYDLAIKNPSEIEHPPESERTQLPLYTNKNLSLISGLYLYTNTPPHGYGTQAPKVAETVTRAYGFNLKTMTEKTIIIMKRNIERMHWERKDKNFPFNEIHGNFIPSESRIMVESFLKSYQPYIDNCVDEVMKNLLETNSDVLTKGRQTYCPFTGQSVTSAVAYKRMYDFLSENSGNKCLSCLEWIQAYFLLFEKEEIHYTTTTWTSKDKIIFDKKTKQKKLVKRQIKKSIHITTSTTEETRDALLTLSTRFASYLKHKERGKKDRRAIASANMILRMFLHIIEEFHLKLSEKIEGATISIGGEEKKQKISSNMSVATLPSGPARAICQGTEDATKWNECMSPSLFALMHHYMFDKMTRIRLGIPTPTEMGDLFSLISVSGNFLMSMKEVQLGQGLMIQNENEYNRMKWSMDWIDTMNKNTQEWFLKIKDKITTDGEYLQASPGMLMGMLNAGSTTVGLLAPNHRMDRNKMKVLTLRSSDDSMSLYMGNNMIDNINCVEANRRNLGMLGINLSPDKTFFFREGIGEYTSWYMEEKFVSQFGTETASIRPKGVNPHDDFYSIAKETSTALSTLTINHVGASIRLRLGIDGTRRIWRINRNVGKRKDISQNVQLLSDGGIQPWNCTNCHLEEISLRERNVVNEAEKNYLLRIQNPENPFAPETKEEMTFSKEHGMLTLETVDTPRTCFSYLKKSNKTLNREDKKEEADMERCNHEASKIINFIDPTTLISYPSANSTISSHLSAILRLEMEQVKMDQDQTTMVTDAIRVLETGDYGLLNEEDQFESWWEIDQEMGDGD